MGSDFQVSFKGTNDKLYAFKLIQTKENPHATIGSKPYSIVVEKGSLEEIQKILRDIPLQEVKSKADLEQHLGRITSLSSPKVANLSSRVQQATGQAQETHKLRWVEEDALFLPQLKQEVGTRFWEKELVAENTQGFIGFINGHLIGEREHYASQFREALANNDRELFISLFQHLSKGEIVLISEREGLGVFPEREFVDKESISDRKMEELHAFQQDIGFSGIASITFDGNHLVRSNRLKDTDAAFPIHSLGKVLTGTLVMLMIQKGIITEKQLDEPIQLEPRVKNLIGDEALKKHLETVTLRQAMTHTGHLGDYLGNLNIAIEEALDAGKEPPTITCSEDLLKYAEGTLYLDEEEHYSNLGSLLVGLSLQHLYNEHYRHQDKETSFNEILREHILEPAGITGYSEVRPEKAHYDPKDPNSYGYGGPAGGAWMTVKALEQFGQWVAKEYQKDKESNNSLANLLKRNGREFSSGGVIEHTGASSSGSSHIAVFLEQGVTSVVLSDQTFFHGELAAKAVYDAMFEHIFTQEMSDVIEGPAGVAIHNYLQAMAEHAHFNGSVLVEQDGKIILSAGYGIESAEVKNSSLTNFHIASLTKQFTAAAVLKLHEEGKVDLHGPINAYLPPQYQSQKWEGITVHQLLSHTAGMSDYTDRPDYWDICSELTVDNVLRDVQTQELKFAPGTDWSYSNTGYLLLGKMIENVSDMPYGDYVRQKILIPSGMNSSGVHDSTYNPPPHAATPYHIGSDRELAEDTRHVFGVLYADGAMYSTTRDMLEWGHILDGKSNVLSPESLELMISNKYGLMSGAFLGHDSIHHGGSMAGFKAHFCKYPDSNLSIIVLGNNMDFPADYIADSVSRQLFHPDSELAPVVPFPKDFDYSPYLRTFNSESLKGVQFTFALSNGRLMLMDEDPAECLLLANNRILVISQGAEFELQPDGSLFAYNVYGSQMDTLSRNAATTGS